MCLGAVEATRRVGGLCLTKPLPRLLPAPCPPPGACTGGPAEALGEARGPQPGVVRASRLLGGFTVRTLRPPVVPTPIKPSVLSIAAVEAEQLRRAKHKIHQVILYHFPGCRRIQRISSGKFEDGGNGADGGDDEEWKAEIFGDDGDGDGDDGDGDEDARKQFVAPDSIKV